MPDFIRIHPKDNVAVALHTIAAGTEFEGVTAQVEIPQGHKMALLPMNENDQVVKYGFSIGHATATIAAGDWVHVHNMKTNLSGEIEYTYNPNITPPAPQAPGTFMGYRRRDGKVGIRNEIWIIPTVGCVNDVAKALVKDNQDLVTGSIDGLYTFPHPFGCSQMGEDHANTRKILADLVHHPNAGGVLVLGLGLGYYPFMISKFDHVNEIVIVERQKEVIELFNKRYGSHVHILDWALHMDESTPHIHERHVFDAKNQYGELCPQQEKALEELGFELPDPTKKKGKYNNRKISFDAECRKMFLDIAHRNGVEIDFEPVYGGVSYLEKQDFIIENQKRRIAENQATLDALTMKISDLEAFVEEVAEDAYEKACEVVSETVAEQTREEDIEELRKYKKWLTSDERKTPKDKRDFVGRCLDNLENKLRSMAQKVADKIMGALQNPHLKEQKKAEVKEHARKSVRALLEANKRLVEELRANVTEAPAQKKSRGEELG